MTANDAAVAEAFQIFDRDNDGKISKGEVATAIRALGKNPTNDELAALLDSGTRCAFRVRLVACAAPRLRGRGCGAARASIAVVRSAAVAATDRAADSAGAN